MSFESAKNAKVGKLLNGLTNSEIKEVISLYQAQAESDNPVQFLRPSSYSGMEILNAARKGLFSRGLAIKFGLLKIG